MIWRSEKKDEESGDDGKGRKIPSGFEKLLRRTKRSITHDDQEEKVGAKKGEEKEASKKKDDDDKESDEMDDDIDSGSKKTTDTKKTPNKASTSSQVSQYFFEPNGGGPIWENILMAALMFGTLVYTIGFGDRPSEEITYMDFVQNYLSKNQVEMITIGEEKNNSMFKFRARIDTVEGKRVHLVLPQVENFLLKLDMA